MMMMICPNGRSLLDCLSNSFVSQIFLCFFFFFQAEDGIRDLTVTGVQTCALPISDFFVHHDFGTFKEQKAGERPPASNDYSITSVTVPAPTVRPPSRIAKRRPF